jgi:hypothetical protein
MREEFGMRHNSGILIFGLILNFGLLGIGALILGFLPNDIDWISISPLFDEITGIMFLLGGTIGLGLSVWSMN